jgi:hypothetical protein
MAPNRVFRACVGQRNPVSWFEGVGVEGVSTRINSGVNHPCQGTCPGC